MNYNEITKLNIDNVDFNDIGNYENGYFYVSVNNGLRSKIIDEPDESQSLTNDLEDPDVQKNCWYIPNKSKYIIIGSELYPKGNEIKTISKIVFNTFFPSKQELFTIEFLKNVFHHDGNYELCYGNKTIEDYMQFKHTISYINCLYHTAHIVEFDLDSNKWLEFYNLMKIN